MSDFYVSTYCNHPHDVKSGKPINHECYVIPPRALKAEMDGDYAQACHILSAQQFRVIHRGIKRK